MSRQTKEQISEVLIAFAEGKAIEYRSPSRPNVWYDCDDEIPIFDFKKYDFRIKKEEFFEISKFEQERCLKEVRYFSINLEINHDYNWIATDEDGSVYSYVDKPKFCMDVRNWKTGDEYEYVGFAVFKGEAKDSLMEIER